MSDVVKIHIFSKRHIPLFIAGGVVFFIILLAFYRYSVTPNETTASRKGDVRTVELREDGFSPQRLTIRKGETVRFATNRNKPFWPASDIHPTHTLYPEFDPQEPVEPEKKWYFRFDQPGEWRYHDHLAPIFTGRITVVDRIAVAIPTDACLGKDPTSRSQCWQGLIESSLEQAGIEDAFRTLSLLYSREPDFAANCHDYVHKIGEAAYRKFAGEESFDIPRETAFCSYGFYHGFMETLVARENSVAKASRFCDFVEKQLAGIAPGAKNACFHGIGHGLADPHNPAFFGKLQAILDSPLRVCDEISRTKLELYLCATGVFNAVEVMSSSRTYGLAVNEKDPFDVCRNQAERFQDACYTNMVPAAMGIAQRDFAKTAAFIETIQKNAYAEEAIKALAAEFVPATFLELMSEDELVGRCRALQNRLITPCLRGIVIGFMKHGTPGREHLQAITFCKNSAISDEERRTCFKQLLGNEIFVYYAYAKARRICESQDEKYRIFCRR